jgi:hypothetical protein
VVLGSDGAPVWFRRAERRPTLHAELDEARRLREAQGQERARQAERELERLRALPELPIMLNDVEQAFAGQRCGRRRRRSTRTAAGFASETAAWSSRCRRWMRTCSGTREICTRARVCCPALEAKRQLPHAQVPFATEGRRGERRVV